GSGKRSSWPRTPVLYQHQHRIKSTERLSQPPIALCSVFVALVPTCNAGIVHGTECFISKERNARGGEGGSRALARLQPGRSRRSSEWLRGPDGTRRRVGRAGQVD